MKYFSDATISLKVIIFLFLIFKSTNCLFSQEEVIIIEEAHPQIKIDYQDSIMRHQDFGEIFHYQPHLCKNRYGRFGWVDKFHKVIIPFEYQEFPSKLSHFNPAKKNGKYGAVDNKGKNIIPFRYSSLTHYKKQGIIICNDQNKSTTVFNEQGKIIIPEKSQYSIWIFNDTTLALQDFDRKDVKTHNLKGQFLRSYPFSYINQLPDGRILSSQHSYANLKIIVQNGLLDSEGNTLIPCEYSTINWVKGDWAYVEVFKTKEKGLLQISTLTLHPMNHLQVNPQDMLGNFTFRGGDSWEKSKLGLINSAFNLIFPPVYNDIYLIDTLGNYVLKAGESNRGSRIGVGNLNGDSVIDTILTGFKPMVYEERIISHEKNIYPTMMDTLPFYVYEDILTRKQGLWHQHKGQLKQPQYDQFEGVSDTSYIQQKGNTSILLNINGDTLAGPYYKIWRNKIYGHLLASKTYSGDYILLDNNGKLIRKLEGEPKEIETGFYCIGRQSNRRSGYGWITEYAIFDNNLTPITGFIYDMEPHRFSSLSLKFMIRVLKDDHPKGYGKWIAYMKEGLGEGFTLIDEFGKTYEIK